MLSEEDIQVLKEIGATLKEHREANGYSLERIADITRISVATLHHIEAGDYKQFPGTVFVRGFIRNYGKLLEIDGIEELIAKFNRVYGKGGASPDNSGHGNPQNHANRITEQRVLLKLYTFLFLGLFLLFAIAIGVGVYIFIGSESSQGQIVIEHLSEEQPSGDTASENSSPIQPAEGTLNPQPSVKKQLVFTVLKSGWLRLGVDENPPIEVYLEEGGEYVWDAERVFDFTMSRADMARITFAGAPYPIDLSAGAQRLYEQSILVDP